MSRRLETIADLVPEGARVADIGTDHARLLPMLLLRRRALVAIGIDRDAGPLQAAARTLARATDQAAVADLRIQLRLGDGLEPLAPHEVDTIVIAGMGTRSIIAILERHPDRIAPATTLVLQPHTEIGKLREWLAAHAITVIDERLVHEHGRPRVVIAARTT